MGTISFDTDTGAMKHLSVGAKVSGDAAAAIAAAVLPGMTPAEVERMYTEYMHRDVDLPFAIHGRVQHRIATLTGSVVDRRETQGELHSVLVRWDGEPGGPEWYSPRELLAL